jgi:hypothetical protein
VGRKVDAIKIDSNCIVVCVCVCARYVGAVWARGLVCVCVCVCVVCVRACALGARVIHRFPKGIS